MTCRKIAQSNNGSALILTILLITAISTVIFSTARLSISDIVQVGRLEESITAQYAAESGLELGLLSYRLNRNSETSPNATSTTSDSFNFDLTNNSATSAQSVISNPSAPSSLMRMWWKEEKLGVTTEFAPYVDINQSPKLFKDQAQELDLTNLAGQDLTIYWTEAYNNGSVFCSNQDSTCFEGSVKKAGLLGIEITLTGIKEDGTIYECGKQLPDYTIFKVNIGDISDQLKWSCNGNNVNKFKLRIKPYIGTFNETDYPYIYYAVSGNMASIDGNIVPIDNGISNIYSVGYYGSTKRALKININRMSTSLSGAYDLILGGLSGGVSGGGQ